MDGEANDQDSRTVIRGNSHLNHGPRTLKLWKWCAREEVRCLLEARPSLKTPAIPPVYKITSANQSTKLVYNLVYSPWSKHPAPRTGVTDAVCWLKSFLDQRGQSYWAGVLGPWALGLGSWFGGINWFRSLAPKTLFSRGDNWTSHLMITFPMFQRRSL